jgi:hypothetical protein
MLNIEEAGSRGDDLMKADTIELVAGKPHVAQTTGMAAYQVFAPSYLTKILLLTSRSEHLALRLQRALRS